MRGFAFLQDRVLEIEVSHDAGAVVLQHHVGLLYEAQKQLPAVCVSEVERDAELVPVELIEVGRPVVVAPERIGSGIPDGASRGPSRSLYLYDLGAEVRKVSCGERPGPVRGNLQHPDAAQGQVFTGQAGPFQGRPLIRRKRLASARELIIRILAQAGRRTTDRRRRPAKLVWKAGQYGATGYGMVHLLEPISRPKLL